MVKINSAAMIMTLALGSPMVLASGSHGGGHSDAKGAQSELSMDSMSMDSLNMDSMSMDSMSMDSMDMGDMGSDHGAMGGHMHSSWEEAPASYQKSAYSRWDSFEMAKQGMTVYRDSCMSCHGVSGRGTGPIASGLKHPPADLTNHFHEAPGKGDAYLYWRVSEGGAVEPFASMDSAMPAFKNVLSEQQRWSVLVYVHQAFHKGFSGPEPVAEGGHGAHH
ncbi:c-type cytochrome [Aestuariirhabdus sp. LZHN29]|uniref:c-type cytochrome n=1 Tax=Aestuariirhabdus sp. LZHN29 TaxID=3417462 RepID=UPI003CED08E4